MRPHAKRKKLSRPDSPCPTGGAPGSIRSPDFGFGFSLGCRIRAQVAHACRDARAGAAVVALLRKCRRQRGEGGFLALITTGAVAVPCRGPVQELPSVAP